MIDNYNSVMQRLTTRKANQESSDQTNTDFSIKWTYSPSNTSESTSTQSSTAPTSKPATKVYSNLKGKKTFDQAFDNVIKRNPLAKKYRQVLTDIANRESGFRSVQNAAGAPAYGYFQFMQDGKKYNNISRYANSDIQTFMNNPELQIEAAIKLAQEFESNITDRDKLRALKKGLDLNSEKGKNAALHGMWLGGYGGFQSWLNGKDRSDRKWSKTGQGTSVGTLIQQYNS